MPEQNKLYCLKTSSKKNYKKKKSQALMYSNCCYSPETYLRLNKIFIENVSRAGTFTAVQLQQNIASFDIQRTFIAVPLMMK